MIHGYDYSTIHRCRDYACVYYCCYYYWETMLEILNHCEWSNRRIAAVVVDWQCWGRLYVRHVPRVSSSNYVTFVLWNSRIELVLEWDLMVLAVWILVLCTPCKESNERISILCPSDAIKPILILIKILFLNRFNQYSYHDIFVWFGHHGN